MLPQRDSILALLADEDSDTAGLVQNQLIARGSQIIGDLRELLPSASGRTERRLREVIAQIASEDAERQFGVLCEYIVTSRVPSCFARNRRVFGE